MLINKAIELGQTFQPDPTIPFEVLNAVSESGFIDTAIFERFMLPFVAWVNGTRLTSLYAFTL